MDVADRSPLPRRPAPSDEPRQPLPRDVRELPGLDADFVDTLDVGIAEIGLELSGAQREALDDHVRLLLAWNEHINLSGLREPQQIARGHVLDALLAVPALREIAKGRKQVTLLDIGSGAGFPGLPLAVALPARRAALVDSIAKKAAFLEVAAAVADDALRATPASSASMAEPPVIEALAERAEDLADEPDHRDGWDLVVARAVGTVAECAELGVPLARRGGHVAIWKRASDAPARAALHKEIGEARRIIQAVGGAPPRVMYLAHADRVGLDGSCLVVIRKIRPTPDRYPRSAGDRRRRTLP